MLQQPPAYATSAGHSACPPAAASAPLQSAHWGSPGGLCRSPSARHPLHCPSGHPGNHLLKAEVCALFEEKHRHKTEWATTLLRMFNSSVSSLSFHPGVWYCSSQECLYSDSSAALGSHWNVIWDVSLQPQCDSIIQIPRTAKTFRKSY